MMRSRRFVFLMLIVMLGIPLSGWAQPTTAQEFIAAYRTAMEEKSVEKLNAMTYRVGMSEEERKKADADQQQEFGEAVTGRTLGEILLEPMPKDFEMTSIAYGKRYEPTCTPTGLIRVNYTYPADAKKKTATNTATLRPYAIVDGHYYLVSTKTTDLGWKGPRDKSLCVMILAKHPVEIAMKWNASGVDLEKTRRTSTLGVLGQYVESATVTLDADDPDVELRVLEGDKVIFKAQAEKGKKTIEYQRRE